ncbi:MAG: divergent PAP2 family protein [Chloroflexota bacterium]
MGVILENKAIVVPASAWWVAQILKVIISLIRDKRLNLSYLVSMGGMPSAHTTLVCSLATTVGITEGLSSTSFAIAAFFAVIVMYDAAGVRQAVGNQANLLNRMLDELFRGQPVFQEHLREFIGHTRIEVLAGAILGIFLGWFWA